ncbi:MAG: L-seryl-tRNA(Sec) selenium transferase [Polyangiales bacterium]
MDRRAGLPAIGRLVAREDVRELIARHGRDPVVDALRDAVEAARAQGDETTSERIVEAAVRSLERAARGTLVPAINATGVVLHTNLGRAPLGEEARRAIATFGSGYSSLEFDLATGERGSRHVHAAARLRRITGAEDALVANNAAAALLLALSALASSGSVIVSRGELVEIGGAFRIPEIVTVGGARLVEIGTTNRTRLDDYRVALAANPGATLLKVHRSNFAIVGFTEETTASELATLGAPLIHDLGSGLLVPDILDEPDVASSVRAGSDIVVFSGDKLLGGPQAGLAVGKSHAIARMRKHPLMRAVRAGKLVLAALDATLAVYERGAASTLPTIAAITATAEVVRARAEAMQRAIGDGEIVATVARVGAGSQPLATLPSFAVRLSGDATRLAERLREGTPLVIGRIESGAFFLDARAVADEEVPVLSDRVRAAIRSTS